jgi:hypothetical protein
VTAATAPPRMPSHHRSPDLISRRQRGGLGLYEIGDRYATQTKISERFQGMAD